MSQGEPLPTEAVDEQIARRQMLRSEFRKRPWLILSLAFSFLSDYRTSRVPTRAAYGLPALVLAAIPVGMISLQAAQSTDESLDQQLTAAMRALDLEDFDTAGLIFRRLQAADPQSERAQFGLALVDSGQGDQESARNRVREIAPLDRPGFAPAHKWQAVDMVRNNTTLNSSQVEQIEHHLKTAIEADGEDEESRRLLCRIYSDQGFYQRAIDVIMPIAANSPFVRVDVARMYALDGDADQSKRQAATAIRDFNRKLAANISDPLLRVGYAEALVHTREWSAAMQLLKEGFEVCDRRHHPALRDIVVRTCVQWFDALQELSGNQKAVAQQLKVLQDGLAIDVSNSDLLGRLAQLSFEHAEDPAVNDAVASALANGDAPATAHFVLGTASLARGDAEAGQRHLRLAHARLPKSPAILNNLAWSLAQDDEKLSQARMLLDQAVSLAPSVPEIRETRGQVLARQKEYWSAITDLEFVLEAQPNRTSAHETLADIYQKLGDDQLAELHRKRAASTKGLQR